MAAEPGRGGAWLIAQPKGSANRLAWLRWHCASRAAWFAGTAPPGPQPLKEPHYKDVERPWRYDGGAENWAEWSRSFRRFLRLRFPRWTALLDAIEALRGKPVTELDEKN